MALQTPGTRSPVVPKGRSVWAWVGLAAGLGAIVVVVLIALVILAHAAHVPIFAANDLVLLLTVVAGLMGTAFVVGGLVVALVAVVEALTVRERMTTILEEHNRQLDQRFVEQQAQARLQADRQIEGYITFQQARDAPDWQSAEALARQALDTHPALPGVRSFLGLRLADEVMTAFAQTHGPSKATYDALTTGLPRPSQGSPPLVEAVSWLTQAREHEDNPGGHVSAALALIHGANGRYDKMLEAVEEAVAVNAALHSYFQMPKHLIMLVHGCGTDRARLPVLGQSVGYQLPAPIEHVRMSAKTNRQGQAAGQYIDWYVVTRAPLAFPASDEICPVLLRLFFLMKSPNLIDHYESLSARCLTLGAEYVTKDVPTDIPLDEMLDALDERFLFICQMRTEKE